MFKVTICDLKNKDKNMANSINKKEPLTNCDQSQMDVVKCEGHELAGNIEPLIKVIRGKQVMLDRDLANLYGVETGQLNRQVKRNIERFPEDFMFPALKHIASQILPLGSAALPSLVSRSAVCSQHICRA